MKNKCNIWSQWISETPVSTVCLLGQTQRFWTNFVVFWNPGLQKLINSQFVFTNSYFGERYSSNDRMKPFFLEEFRVLNEMVASLSFFEQMIGSK